MHCSPCHAAARATKAISATCPSAKRTAARHPCAAWCWHGGAALPGMKPLRHCATRCMPASCRGSSGCRKAGPACAALAGDVPLPRCGPDADSARRARVPEAPAKPPKALEMVRVLVEGHEAVARTARSLFPLADKASDEPTADLLTQRLTVHEQTAWMLRSLLEE